MKLHPSLRVGYRVALAAWLRGEGLPFDSIAVDHLVEEEANWIEARNHLAIDRGSTDSEIAGLFDLDPATVPGIRAELRRQGEVRVEDL